jgi:hypothetical protein
MGFFNKPVKYEMYTLKKTKWLIFQTLLGLWPLKAPSLKLFMSCVVRLHFLLDKIKDTTQNTCTKH